MNRPALEKLLANLATITSKYFHVYQKLVNRNLSECNVPNDPLQLNKIFLKLFNKIFSEPDLIIKYQMSFFQTQLETIEAVCQRYYSDLFFPMAEKKDKRFKDNIWEEHVTFAWFKEAYFTYARWLEDIIQQLPKDDFTSVEVRRLNFIMKQFLDAIAPSNFPATNPEVLRAFFDSQGENFIKGLDNLLQDLEHSKQLIQIKTSDNSQFILGENIAATEGKVIYQNKIMQLIHYKPVCAQHYSIPILIVSPFINKYYVMDLDPNTSMIKWLLEQKYNVFLISWVNPDESLAEENFEDYMLNGPIAALDYMSTYLKIEQVNAIGYCIGGTLLATTLAYMKVQNDTRIKSASFLTTLLDFADAGDLSIFVDDHFIKEVERYMKASGGYLDGRDIAATFSLLRSNDMIWPFYINNYLLGRETFPFNLLYWNADSIRMPMALHLFYLQNMYKDNLLKIPGGLIMNGQAIDLSKINIPCFVAAAKGDHIVPWQNAFNSAKLFSGPLAFVLADSGHIAGMMNHPKQNKYCYWINPNNAKAYVQPEHWSDEAKERAGSWWSYWNEWAKAHSGELEPAQDPELINPNIIEDAPGSYVRVRC